MTEPRDDDIREFLRAMPRGDRERLGKAISRLHSTELRVVDEYRAMAGALDRSVEATVSRGDRAVRSDLTGHLFESDRSGRMAVTESPDGLRVRVDGNTERRLAAARNRVQGTVRVVMRAMQRDGAAQQARARDLAREHVEALGDAERAVHNLAVTNDRLDELRSALGDPDGEIADQEHQAMQEPDDDRDIEETYQDDIAKLSSLYLDSARGRIATWRNAPRVQTARAQIGSVGLHRGSAHNTIAGSARAVYRRAISGAAIKQGQTHAERRSID